MGFSQQRSSEVKWYFSMRSRSYPDLPKVTVSTGARISAFAFFFFCLPLWFQTALQGCVLPSCTVLLRWHVPFHQHIHACSCCVGFVTLHAATNGCLSLLTCVVCTDFEHIFFWFWKKSSIHCDKASKVLFHWMTHFSKIGDQCCALVPWGLSEAGQYSCAASCAGRKEGPWQPDSCLHCGLTKIWI